MSMTCDRLSSISDDGVKMSCASDSAGDCQCHETVTNRAVTEEGTYTVSGTSVTMTKSDSSDEPSPSDYCVQGNTLMLRDFGAPKGSGDGSSLLLLTKQ